MIQKFGGDHTKTKLDAVQSYLDSYTTALSKQNFELVYFDAFAGTGSIDFGNKESNDGSEDQLWLSDDEFKYADVEQIEEFSDGSARRALQINKKFDRYIFVENISQKIQYLKKLEAEFPSLASRIDIRHSDANVELIDFCEKTDWKKTRSVVFLDPFGSQVDYNTIIKIAQTKAIDLWYLFPSGLSVFRQISKKGKMTFEQRSSIVRIMGTSTWENDWISEDAQLNFLEEEKTVGKKQVEIDEITRFMINQMKKNFKGGVLDNWLPLGKDGAHWYSLLFAWANPSPKAKLAAKLASHVMTRK